MVSKRTLPTAEVLKSQLRTIGVNLAFEQFEDATRLARQWKREFDLDLRGEGYPLDPESFFQYYYSKTGPRNFTGYQNPEFDRLYDAALVELDFQKRRRIIMEMTRLIERDLPEILLYASNRYFGWRENVKGFEPNFGAVTLYDGGGIETTWIDRP